MENSSQGDAEERKISKYRSFMPRIKYDQSNISAMMLNQRALSSYNPFKCPPDLQVAKDHGKSQRVCKPKVYIKDGEVIDNYSFVSGFSQRNYISSANDPKENERNKIFQDQENKMNQREDNQRDDEITIGKNNQDFLYSHFNEEQIGITDQQTQSRKGNLPYSLHGNNQSNSKICPCCGFEINNELIPLKCQNTEFVHLGISYPLYFDFIKQCAILLTIHFFCSSIPLIIINLRSDQCSLLDDSSFVCNLSFLNILQKSDTPTGNYHKHALSLENLCNMIFLIISMIVISIFKIQQKIKKQKLEKYNCSISDFSIFVTNLPQQFTMEELHQYLRQKLLQRYPSLPEDMDLEVVKEYKLYDLKEYAQLYQQKINLINKKLKKNKIQRKLMQEHALYAVKIANPELLLEEDNLITQKKETQKKISSSGNKNSQIEKKQLDSQIQGINVQSVNSISSNNFTMNGLILNSLSQNNQKGEGLSSYPPQRDTLEQENNNISKILFKETEEDSFQQDKEQLIEENEIKNLSLIVKEDDNNNNNKFFERNSLNEPLIPNQQMRYSKEQQQAKKVNEEKLIEIVSRLAELGAEQNQLSEEIQKTSKRLENFEVTMVSSIRESEREINFSRKAIITFNNYEIAKKIKDAFKMTFKEKIFFIFKHILPFSFHEQLSQYYFKETLVKVRRAPQPSDILWTNIGSTKSKFKYYIVSYVVTYFLIAASFLFLLLLKKGIKQAQGQQSSLVSLLLSFSASTIVAIFNSILGIVIRWGATFEEHDVQTKYFVSVGKKLTKMFIINMVVSTLLSNMVTYLTNKNKQFPFDAIGLMNDFFFLFITNSYIGSIFNIFDIVWAVRLIKRSRAHKDNSTMTQMEANNLFEGHPIDMALRYANINKTVLFTASVSPFIPIGVPLSIIGLFITYWVDKYLLLRRYVCKNYLSFSLAKSMLNQFKIYAVFFAFGNMLTMFMPVSIIEINDKDNDDFVWPGTQKSPYFYAAILGFLIALVFRYFPMMGLYDLYNCVFKEKYKKREIHSNYLDIKDDLADDYDYYHPIFKDNTCKKSGGTTNKNKKQEQFYSHSDNDYQQMFKSIQNQIDLRKS